MELLSMNSSRLSLNYFFLHPVLPIWVMSFITLFTGLDTKLLLFIGPNKSKSFWVVSVYRLWLSSVHISLSFKVVVFCRWEKWGSKKLSGHIVKPTRTRIQGQSLSLPPSLLFYFFSLPSFSFSFFLT